MFDEVLSSIEILTGNVIVDWAIRHVRFSVGRNPCSVVIEVDSTLTCITGHRPIEPYFG